MILSQDMFFKFEEAQVASQPILLLANFSLDIKSDALFHYSWLITYVSQINPLRFPEAKKEE